MAMVKITGRHVPITRLNKLRGPTMIREVGKAVYVAADMLSTEAAISITTGAVSGAGHVPSAPGTPPNADTHKLDRSIHTERVDGNPLAARSVADAPYAVDQELGNSRLPARPYMAPAARKVRPDALRLVAAAVDRVSKGGTL